MKAGTRNFRKSNVPIGYLDKILKKTKLAFSKRGMCLQGDVGGPILSYEKDTAETLIGINSFVEGVGCSLGWPLIFTQVSPYVRWINKITGIPIRTKLVPKQLKDIIMARW